MGNRTSASSTVSGLAPVSGSYNVDDELSNETYDQDGNVTAAEGKTFAYDSQNELVTMDGGAVQVMYDGDGNRVAKAVKSGGVTTTTYYLVDDLNPTGLPQVMDELTNGVVTRTYTYGLQRISEDQVVNGAWTPSYYSYDGMGSVRQLTNTAGAVTDSYEYDAFGNQISSTGSTPNEMLYRGEQWDADLGLCYLRARFYNPLSGRFMSRDPGDGNIPAPITLHKYLYAAASPTNWRDPSGRDIIEDALIISNRSLGAKEYLNTLGCFSNVLLVAAADQFNAWTKGGVAGATYGCVSSFIWPGGDAWLSIKTTVDVGFCGFGLIQVANDFSEELQGQNVTNKSYLVDALNGVLQCAVTQLGKILAGEH